MRKLGIVLTAALLCGGPILAQENPFINGAVRVTNCVGFQARNFDAQILCNISAFAEHDGYGVFLQVTPRYGPILDNFQVRGYTNRLDWQILDFMRLTQTGVTIGRELGEFFVRFETDILIEFSF